jgi:hypothetical protein
MCLVVFTNLKGADNFEVLVVGEWKILENLKCIGKTLNWMLWLCQSIS